MCACTMIFNAARFLPEWTWYHHRIGVEQFFFYDNGSDDSTEEVILRLVQNGIPTTRIPWPWPKAQQGGSPTARWRPEESASGSCLPTSTSTCTLPSW